MSLIVSGVGRLGKEPKLQYTPSGTAQCSFSLAVDTGFGDKKETIWLSCVSFGNVAETYNKYLKKGSRIAFTGEITSIKPYTMNDETLGVYNNVKLLTVDFIDGINKNTGEDESVEEF